MTQSQKIICLRVTGGLGNQMYQYGAGYALAKHMGAKLVLDTVKLKKDKLRDYALTKFGVPEDIIISDTINWIGRRIEKRLNDVRSIFGINKKLMGLKLVKEHEDFSANDFFGIDQSCYLWGYWASPRFFRGAENDIRRIFDFNQFANEKTNSAETKIESTTISVSVHIRRGDYEANKFNLQRYGLLRRNYYDLARDIIDKKTDNQAHYFVMSDELNKAKEELSHWSNTEFIDGGSQEGDLMLMQKCNHNIIANSTFSQWAAWLNPNVDKIIIAPKMLNESEKNNKNGPPEYKPQESLSYTLT